MGAYNEEIYQGLLGLSSQELEIYFITSTGMCPLHPPQVGNERTVLHSISFANPLKNLVGIGHLGDLSGTAGAQQSGAGNPAGEKSYLRKRGL